MRRVAEEETIILSRPIPIISDVALYSPLIWPIADLINLSNPARFPLSPTRSGVLDAVTRLYMLYYCPVSI